MDLITYENPIIIDGSNPIAIANQSFPYNEIADSRRFEEFIYSLYKSEIELGHFGGFDGISLMSGVRERGRDCALLKNGKNYGLIQCKKYNRNFNQEEFGKEITKFILYSLLEPSLIHDINDFTYYIAVSTGFVYECTEFINDFNNRILNESKLDKWISENISSPTLSCFALKSPKNEVLNILSKIKVKKIGPVDLDILLSKDINRNIPGLFFQIRTVTDNSKIEQFDKKFDKYLNHILTVDQLNTQLNRGSISVKSQKNEFEGIPDSHIPRTETDELFNWTMATVLEDREGKAQNICLLAGNAGMGKTVIIKDLYEKLLQERIPVLALKADKLYSSSLSQLQEKINLSIPVFEFIEQCKQEFPKLVIIIDQIDALSQSLTSDRSFLYTFTQLIDTYKYESTVRIIISVRIFDLFYDPSLKVYKNIKSIEVKKLSSDAVLSQLKKIGLEKDGISNGLLELLQVPNNLDVFSRIFNKNINFAGVTSIQGLYSELWKYKILNKEPSLNIDTDKLIELLYSISKKMFDSQQITVNENIFDPYTKELNYLKTEQLIKTDNKDIQFFHQSFYDIIFAKRFVESKNSIKAYIKGQDQSIMLRPALKMIINYLREFDHKLYIKQFRNIIKSRKTFFHIKHLLISTLSTVENPSDKEKEVFLKNIMPTPIYYYAFYEHVRGYEWIKYLLSNNLMEKFITNNLKNYFSQQAFDRIKRLFNFSLPHKNDTNRNLEVCLQLLQRNLESNCDSIIEFLFKVNNEDFISRLLYGLKDWKNPRVFELLDKHPNLMNKDNWSFYHLLGNILEYNPDYVFNKLKTVLSSDETAQGSHHKHEPNELLKKLIEKLPEQLLNFFIERIEHDIEKKQYVSEFSDLISDYAVSEIDLKDDENLTSKDFIYQLLASNLRKQAFEESKYFKEFLLKYRNSKFKGILKLLVFALQTNEQKYGSDIFDLINYLSSIKFFDSYGRLNHEIRNLLRSSFNYFTSPQKKRIIEIIKNLKVYKELYLWKDDQGKKWLHSYFGLTKYYFLNCLPESIISGDQLLKKEYKELTRKYIGYKDDPGNRSFGGTVHAPLRANAYQKMNKENWLNSFKKYNSDNRSYNHVRQEDFLKGGLLEHSRAFSAAVAENPSKHLEIINSIIDDAAIPIDYSISGVEGLQKSGFSRTHVCEFLTRIIQKNLNRFNMLSCIWIANHLLAGNVFNKQIIDFIIYHALNNPDPEKEAGADKKVGSERRNGMANDGINTVRGAAANALLYLTDKNYENDVFQTLEKILDNDLDKVKAAITYHFAYLTNLNRERAFKLFLSVTTRNDNENILPLTVWSAQYFIHYDFKSLVPYFEKLTALEMLHDDDIHIISSILFAAWLNNYPNAERLFKIFLKVHPEAHARAVGDAFDNYYFKSEVSSKSLEVLEMFLEEGEPNVSRKFEIEFLHIEHIKFKDIYPFLLKYVQSENFKINNYFLEYLTANSNQNPVECINLFELAIKKGNIPNEQDGYFFKHEDNATKFIIGAYSMLRPKQTKKHKLYQTKLLKAFDKILMDDRFKSKAENVLEKVIA